MAMAMAMAMTMPMRGQISPVNINFQRSVRLSIHVKDKFKLLLNQVRCTPIQQIQQQTDVGILCEPCNGKGWLTCDFCEGQKTNVKADNKRIYRRCPSCRAVGYILCPKCKVFKCVTYPNDSDVGNPSF